MDINIQTLLRISRPRFWIYELGPYLIGLAGAGLFVDYNLINYIDLVFVLIFGLYFLIPANLLIYGINDVYDYETDKLNPKKTEYEDLLPPSLHEKIIRYVIFTNTPFAILVFFVPNITIDTILFFVAFIFFAVQYSAKPIRAKARPIMDSFFSAAHYVATGVFGFLFIKNLTGVETAIPWFVIMAGMLWAMAMHAFSAVPDRDADMQAGLKTIVIFFGQKKTIALSALAYLFSGLLVYEYIGYVATIFSMIYIVLMFSAWLNLSKPDKLFGVYKIFPYINTLCGFIIFIVLATNNTP